MSKTQTYICDIAPFAHIPLSREQFFWYTSDRELTPGTLVTIPLFRRTVRGVVLQSRTAETAKIGKNIRLKSVSGVLRENYFTHSQIAIATHIAETTFTSLGTVLGSMYVSPTAERHTPQDPVTPLPLPKLHTHARDTHKELCAGHYAAITACDSAHTERDGLYAHTIRDILKKNPTAQVLILLPEILLTEHTARTMRALFPDTEIATVHNKRSKGALWTHYEEVATGTARIIVGTKKAALLPFANLALIIMDEAHDMSFKQWDRAPRFDMRTVADTLARMHDCPLLMASAAPRITRAVPTTLGPSPVKPPVTLVDMKNVHFERIKEANKNNKTKKRKKPSITLFSPELIDAVTKAVDSGKQALLFFNHKGMSAFSLCADCGALLACPDCDRALVLDKNGHYECFHCTYITSIFPKCAHCGCAAFRNVGYGTSKIETMLTKLFPQARIARIDGHSMRGTHAARELLNRTDDIDIIIGTQMALKDWRSDRLSVVGILDADALLSIPDISADERLFAFIANAAAAVTHTRSTGMVYVQTYTPSYHLFAHACALNYAAFRKATLADRKTLKYPPYWRAVKLVFQHKENEKAQKLAEDFRTKILTQNERMHTDGDNSWLVSDVHAPLLPKLRGLCRAQIVIRLKNPPRTTAPIPEALATLLAATPPKTLIDIDPVSLV